MKMKDSISFWFYVGVKLASIWSQKQNFLLAGDKLSPCQQHDFLRSDKIVKLITFQHIRCIGVGVSCTSYRHMLW